MKKTFYFILFLLVSCAPSNLGDRVIYQIEKQLSIELSKDGKSGLGDYMYSFYVNETINKNDYRKILLMKGIVDKVMNQLPTVINEKRMSAFGDYLYDRYEWEDPQTKIVFEIQYKGDVTNAKFWITKK
jgi:hypothetical protein